MHRFWFLTTTTYGTWLPGDARGFVGPTRDTFGFQWIHNLPGTEYDRDVPDLNRHSEESLKGPPIVLKLAQANALFEQFCETARIREWNLSAVGIMRTHVHRGWRAH